MKLETKLKDFFNFRKFLLLLDLRQNSNSCYHGDTGEPRFGVQHSVLDKKYLRHSSLTAGMKPHCMKPHYKNFGSTTLEKR